MDLRSLPSRAARMSWIIVALTLITTGVAAWRVNVQPVRYEATVLQVVGPSPSLAGADLLRVTESLNNRTLAPTFADMLASTRVVNAALDRAQVPADRRASYRVQASEEPDSQVIRVIVQGPDRRLVGQIARQVQAAGQELLRETFPQYQLGTLESPAEPSAERVGLAPQLVLIGAAIVGLALGVIAAWWADSWMLARSGRAAEPLARAASPARQ